MVQKKRYLRYLILLTILLIFSIIQLHAYLKVKSWREPLSVQVVALNGDGSDITQSYIDSLSIHDFQDVVVFFNRESSRYGIQTEPIISLYYEKGVASTPPELPHKFNVLSNVFWSLSFRAWSVWMHTKLDSPRADVTLFAVYFDPSKNPVLSHSAGLQKGMIGLINVFSSHDYRGSNHVILAHELLHTVGASDKYDPENNLPIYPIGYSQPQKKPLYPQKTAEIMGGRIPLSPIEVAIPAHLNQVEIGYFTAIEIGWRP